MTSKQVYNHNFDFETELRFAIPLSKFLELVQLQSNPLVSHPITITEIYDIEQSWFDLPPARLRLRKVSTPTNEISFFHTTKYPLTPTTQLEYENSISAAEYKILSFIYQKQPKTSKRRYYFLTPENPSTFFSADLYDKSKEVIIEVETDNPENIHIPQWILDYGEKRYTKDGN